MYEFRTTYDRRDKGRRYGVVLVNDTVCAATISAIWTSALLQALRAEGKDESFAGIELIGC